MSALEARGVSVRLGGVRLVNRADLALEPSKTAALLGPSGAGKSTLLRAFSGLVPLESGEILINGETMATPSKTAPPETRGLGVVFQDYALFPHLTVAGNVGFGLMRSAAAERAARTREALAIVDLEGRANAWPHELSGGEQQRVALARALAIRPKALLLDEPFSSLDGALRIETRERTLAALKTTGAAALIVTHDAEEAMCMAERLHLMADGRVIQSGAPEDIYLNPVSVEAARLTGEVNTWRGAVTNGVLETPFGPMLAPDLDNTQADAILRPEALLITRDARGAARVTEQRMAGASAQISIMADDSETVWRARAPLAAAPQTGDRVQITFDPALMRVVKTES